MPDSPACGPLYDAACAWLDGDGPVPDLIIAMALRNTVNTDDSDS